MLIYQAQPNKCFPPLTNAIIACLRPRNYEFGIQMESIDKQFCYALYRKDAQENRVWNQPAEFLANPLPYDLKVQRVYREQPLDFVYGVFDEFRIDKQKEDYCFTIIKNPVDRIYDLYFFIQWMVFKKIHTDNTILQVLQTLRPNFNLQYTLEGFIDLFLETKGQIPFGTLQWAPNIFFQQQNLNVFDFVGFVEKFTDVIEFFHDALVIPIPTDASLYVSNNVKGTYRRAELEKLLDVSLQEFQTRFDAS